MILGSLLYELDATCGALSVKRAASTFLAKA
jgi:hypothetical protein